MTVRHPPKLQLLRTMPNNLRLYAAPLLTIVLATVHVNAVAVQEEENLRRILQIKIPELKIETVAPSEINGLYEITADSRIFYSNPSGSHIIIGNIFDTISQENLTEIRFNKINNININDLPFQHAIKIKNGTGARVIATFFDPNCSFCKKMSPELNKIPNSTIYIFLYPILSADSVIKSGMILCADNRSLAWRQWIQKGKITAPRRACQPAITNELLSLGKKLNIKGTPTTFLPSGERTAGFISRKDLTEKIDRK
ncbi:DsbC family protein [Burkholderia cepacia]|uniref:Thiol:disulfide interchange protein n=1 Tax=Burkholderia cepacia GG4 TaxID=1009846 RepID=A0A9W3PAU9_BURCE|nr:DsbC family protein [Burkholderia cepacia]AFQ49870.1 Protein-disulfide isomerase [Burkholderia cepacia GG4]